MLGFLFPPLFNPEKVVLLFHFIDKQNWDAEAKQFSSEVK